MTKTAIKRRQNIRAMRTLIREYGYHPSHFEIDQDRDFLMKRLPGTPVLWIDSVGEADEIEPVRELRSLRLADRTDWARLAKEDDIRLRFQQPRSGGVT